MKTETNLRLVVAIESSLDPWMSLIGQKPRVTLNLSNGLDSRYESLIGELGSDLWNVSLGQLVKLINLILYPRCIWFWLLLNEAIVQGVLLAFSFLLVSRLVLALVLLYVFDLWQSPSQYVPIAIVVVRHSFPDLGNLMNDFDEPIDKTDDLLAKLLNSFWELFDVTNGEHQLDLPTRDLQLHEVLIICQGACHDLSTFATEASLKQVTDLKDRMLQHLCFKLVAHLLRFVPIRLLRFFEWRVCQLLNDVNDLFDWHLHAHSDDVLKLYGHNCKDEASEYDREEVPFGF